MNEAYTELAKILKERDNKHVESLIIGNIVSPLPTLKVKIHDKVILDKHNLIVAGHIFLHYKNGELDTWLQVGDEVSLMPTSNSQVYYLIDKVVRL